MHLHVIKDGGKYEKKGEFNYIFMSDFHWLLGVLILKFFIVGAGI